MVDYEVFLDCGINVEFESSTLTWISSVEFFELEIPFHFPWWGSLKTVLFSQMEHVDYTCASYT